MSNKIDLIKLRHFAIHLLDIVNRRNKSKSYKNSLHQSQSLQSTAYSFFTPCFEFSRGDLDRGHPCCRHVQTFIFFLLFVFQIIKVFFIKIRDVEGVTITTGEKILPFCCVGQIETQVLDKCGKLRSQLPQI